MENQDNINGFLDSMDEFDSMPAEQAPSVQSVPYTPAAVWPGEEQTPQQPVTAAPAPAETLPPTAPSQPVIQQPAPQVQPTAPAVKAQPAMQQQQILTRLRRRSKMPRSRAKSVCLKRWRQSPRYFPTQGLRRILRTGTQPLRICGKTTKTVSNPGSDKVYEIKAEIEKSKAFKDALKKAKTDAEKNPECTVKVFKKAQSKGEALSGFKEFCLTKDEALKTEKPIVLLPSKDGRVYEQRRNEIGCFTAPAENIRELESITPCFEPALPKIPAHIFSKMRHKKAKYITVSVTAFLRRLCTHF